MAKSNTERADLYQEITDEIIAMLEAGTRPWSPRWASAAASMPLRSCGTAYRGINILLLWAQSMRRGFANPYWMTFKQAQEMGGCVRKGEKGSRIVFASTLKPKDDNVTSIEGDERRIAFLKRYTVFNIEQIDGLPEGKFPTPSPSFINPEERSGELDAFFARYGVPMREQGGAAFYDPSADAITMPAFADFTSANAFYSVLAHEAIHSTGHASRIDRDTLRNYGKSREIRANEELIAEIGAAMICAVLGMEPTEREDHAAYVASWLTALRNDKRAIFKAATAAQAASDFILAAADQTNTERAAA